MLSTNISGLLTHPKSKQIDIPNQKAIACTLNTNDYVTSYTVMFDVINVKSYVYSSKKTQQHTHTQEKTLNHIETVNNFQLNAQHTQ